MNENNNLTIVPENGILVSTSEGFIDQDNHPNFIESNTKAVTFEELNRCIVPTFSDNSLTIAHQQFINTVREAATNVFGELTETECRASHPIIGRIPSALHKRANELREDEKTLFYQRLAWCCHIKDLTREINGQTIYLCIGGVRAYNEDKLYARKSPEKFKVFVGWQVRVCSNLMLTRDGYSGVIECMSELDLLEKTTQLFKQFKPKKEENLALLENLGRTTITEQQFCQIIGRLRLYQALSTEQQRELPEVILGDQAINAATRNYTSNPNFGKKEGEDITCWNLMQLLNEAVKSSYVDKWLERNQNCTDFAIGIQKAIENEDNTYGWFLN
ncbi:MAG: DUF3871 family protein [Bacteroidaceae bacterium]|nr:DUF3871 family protein [Bacteroidaceae bacterium]